MSRADWATLRTRYTTNRTLSLKTVGSVRDTLLLREALVLVLMFWFGLSLLAAPITWLLSQSEGVQTWNELIWDRTC